MNNEQKGPARIAPFDLCSTPVDRFTAVMDDGTSDSLALETASQWQRAWVSFEIHRAVDAAIELPSYQQGLYILGGGRGRFTCITKTLIPGMVD